MNCTNCGSALMQPSTFCSTCGQLITPAAHPAVAPPAWPPAEHGTAPELDAASQFPRSSYEQYPPSDDDTVEFPAIPADPQMAPAYATAMPAYESQSYAPAPGYSPPPSPPPHYGPPVSPAVGYGPPVSPAVGYDSPVSPYVGYGSPAQVPAYAQQAAYAPDQTYAETYAPTSFSAAPMDTYTTAPAPPTGPGPAHPPDYAADDGFGAPGQPYAGAPAGYGQPTPADYGQPAPADYGQPTGYDHPTQAGYNQPNSYDYPASAGYGEPIAAGYGEPIAAGYGQPTEQPDQLPPDHQPHVYGTPTQTPDNKLSTMAFVLAALAVLILPFIVGLAAIVVSNKAAKHGEPLAPLAYKVSLAGTAIGCVLSGVVLWLL